MDWFVLFCRRSVALPLLFLFLVCVFAFKSNPIRCNAGPIKEAIKQRERQKQELLAEQLKQRQQLEQLKQDVDVYV